MLNMPGADGGVTSVCFLKMRSVTELKNNKNLYAVVVTKKTKNDLLGKLFFNIHTFTHCHSCMKSFSA